MTTSEILEGIFEKQAEIGMTNQQFSDASSVPKATIERIKRGDTANPTIQTILDLAAAVGYTFSNIKEDAEQTAGSGIKDPMVLHMINVYENRGRAYEERIKRTTSHFNMLLAEKNRWLKFSLSLNLILVIFICGILVYDITNLDRGWIQEVMSHYTSWDSVENALIAFRTFISNVCSI